MQEFDLQAIIENEIDNAIGYINTETVEERRDSLHQERHKSLKQDHLHNLKRSRLRCWAGCKDLRRSHNQFSILQRNLSRSWRRRCANRAHIQGHQRRIVRRQRHIRGCDILA